MRHVVDYLVASVFIGCLLTATPTELGAQLDQRDRILAAAVNFAVVDMGITEPYSVVTADSTQTVLVEAVAARVQAPVVDRSTVVVCRPNARYPEHVEDCFIPSGLALVRFGLETEAADSAVVFVAAERTDEDGHLYVQGQQLLMRRVGEAWEVGRVLSAFSGNE